MSADILRTLFRRKALEQWEWLIVYKHTLCLRYGKLTRMVYHNFFFPFVFNLSWLKTKHKNKTENVVQIVSPLLQWFPNCVPWCLSVLWQPASSSSSTPGTAILDHVRSQVILARSKIMAYKRAGKKMPLQKRAPWTWYVWVRFFFFFLHMRIDRSYVSSILLQCFQCG